MHFLVYCHVGLIANDFIQRFSICWTNSLQYTSDSLSGDVCVDGIRLRGVLMPEDEKQRDHLFVTSAMQT